MSTVANKLEEEGIRKMSKTEAREYLKAKGALKQRLIDLAYGRPYGSKPILVPLSKALKLVDEASKDILSHTMEGTQVSDLIAVLKKWFGEIKDE